MRIPPLATEEFMVILPAYNEEQALKGLILQLDNYFQRKQILIADDGSSDNTPLLAKRLGVKMIQNKKNQGKGFILRKAFMTIISQMPNIKWVFTIDADGQHKPRDIPKFISTIKNNPDLGIVNGRRMYFQMPSINRISNRLTSTWCKYWLKWNIDDLQCGYRVYKVESLKKIIDYGLTSRKFDLETEVMFIAWMKDIKIAQIPVTTTYEGQRRRSRIKPATDTFRWVYLGMKFGFKFEFFHRIWIIRRIAKK